MNSLAAEQAAMPDFQAELAGIIDKPLTAETIDIYAESALDDLAELIQGVAQNYPANQSVSGKDLEDAACAYFGLDQIEEILDHVAAKAEEIQALDTIIADADTVDKVITPPDAIRVEANGDGMEFQERETVPRLKTLLFILANDFDVDVNDRKQLRITKGALEDNMLRQESYYSVEARKLGRTVLVCDERSNATFVFDTNLLSQDDINADQLIQLSKDELSALLENNPQAGQRIVYGKGFVPRIITALAEPLSAASSNRVYAEHTGQYLAPRAPEDVLSLYGLAKTLGISGETVAEVIQEAGDVIGEADLYKFRGTTAAGYTPEQQELIRQYLGEHGFDEAPEGFMHRWDLSRTFGVDMRELSKAIEKLGDDLGEVSSYKSTRRRTQYYSPEQQEMIRQRLEATGIFNDEAPEGFLTQGAMAKHYGISPTTMKKVIGELGGELGETQSYIFNGQSTTGYSPEQQEIVRQGLETVGLLRDDAPEGYLSIKGMVDAFGASYETVTKAIDILGETLGETQNYKFKTSTATGYSPGQQEMIRAHLESLYVEAPDGYLTVAAIAKQLGISHRPIADAVEELEKELGETQNYTFKSRPTPGYSPHQQEVVMQHVIAKWLN